jgi:phage-related protein
MKWNIEILNKKVLKELQVLPSDLQAKFTFIADMLIDFGPNNISAPYVKPLKYKNIPFWEIRLKGKSGIARAVYVTAKEKRIVVLHAFVKKTQKTPQKNLQTCYERFYEVPNDY